MIPVDKPHADYNHDAGSNLEGYKEPAYWWCPSCKEAKTWQCVTFDERCFGCGHPVESKDLVASQTEPLKDEELRRDVADLLRQFNHVNVPLEECSAAHQSALLNNATFVLQLMDRHGYTKRQEA